MKNAFHYTIRASSLGNVLLAGGERGLHALFLGASEKSLIIDLKERFPDCDIQRNDSALEFLASQAMQAVESSKDVSIPLNLHGTEFQLKVWKALQRIPFGSTRTYTQIAQKIGSPSAVRAVANACGANPVAVIVPCHRVIRSNGSLSGYRWGVKIKETLLHREAALASRERK